MNISGKVIQVFAEVKGEGKNGPWVKQDFIIETDDQYPKKVCISVWNNKINVKDLIPGELVDIEILIESREYNGKWYTDVKATGLIVNKVNQEQVVNQSMDPFDISPEIKPNAESIKTEESNQEDDLPF